MKAHGHVGKKISAGIVAVRADPAHLRRQMHHDGGLDLAIQPVDIRLVGQIEILAADDDDVGVAALFKLALNGRADKAVAAGEEKTIGSGKIHGRYLMRIGIQGKITTDEN